MSSNPYKRAKQPAKATAKLTQQGQQQQQQQQQQQRGAMTQTKHTKTRLWHTTGLTLKFVLCSFLLDQ